MALPKLLLQVVMYGGQILGRSILRAWKEAEIRT
jgi:hypothetical protein